MKKTNGENERGQEKGSIKNQNTTKGFFKDAQFIMNNSYIVFKVTF